MPRLRLRLIAPAGNTLHLGKGGRANYKTALEFTRIHWSHSSTVQLKKRLRLEVIMLKMHAHRHWGCRRRSFRGCRWRGRRGRRWGSLGCVQPRLSVSCTSSPQFMLQLRGRCGVGWGGVAVLVVTRCLILIGVIVSTGLHTASISINPYLILPCCDKVPDPDWGYSKG